jgi:hypothetical protein
VQDTQAFAPFYKVSVPTSQVGTLLKTVTHSAASAPSETSAFPGVAPNTMTQLQITNCAATSFAFVNLGIAGAVVTVDATTGYPIPPLSTRTVSINPEVTAASVAMSAGSGIVRFTRGGGV